MRLSVRGLAQTLFSLKDFLSKNDTSKMYKDRLESIMAKIHKDIIKLLSEKPLTLNELAEQLEKTEKKVFNALKKLFSDGKIDSDAKNRTYVLTEKQS